LVTHLRRLGPERIRQTYTWDRVTEQYVTLLEQVIAGRSDSRQRMRFLRAGLASGTLFLLVAFVGLLGTMK
jgi:hypothetical protein